ncbi:MAG: hypothetical protein ACLRM8_08585 [Alistipes sp.]
MEEALGMSFAGKRALVCMKHVGLNGGRRLRQLGDDRANGGRWSWQPTTPRCTRRRTNRIRASAGNSPRADLRCGPAEHTTWRGRLHSRAVPDSVLMRLTTRMAHSRAVVEQARRAPKAR